LLLTHIKQAIKTKTSASYKLPRDKELAGIIHEANLYVCSLCEPSELLRENMTFEEDYNLVLRHLENGLVLKIPEYPNFRNKLLHLQMDEALSYATIYYACFIISKHKDMSFKANADEVINIYRSNFSNIIYGRCCI